MGHLRREPLDAGELLAEDDPAAGALLLFAGTVRNSNDDRPVEGLSYSAHETMAERILGEIEAEAVAKFEVSSCHILHRLGDLALGDVSVLIGVRSAHRAAAYEASRYAIEELKKRVPIFKEEHYTDGSAEWLPGTPLAVPDDEAAEPQP